MLRWSRPSTKRIWDPELAQNETQHELARRSLLSSPGCQACQVSSHVQRSEDFVREEHGVLHERAPWPADIRVGHWDGKPEGLAQTSELQGKQPAAKRVFRLVVCRRKPSLVNLAGITLPDSGLPHAQDPSDTIPNLPVKTRQGCCAAHFQITGPWPQLPDLDCRLSQSSRKGFLG